MEDREIEIVDQVTDDFRMLGLKVFRFCRIVGHVEKLDGREGLVLECDVGLGR